MNPDIITAIAATLTTISLLPQMLKVITSQDTKAISLWMYILYVLGVGFWTLAGVVFESWPMIIGNGIALFFAITILCIKIKNDVISK